MTSQEILALPMESDDTDAKTIRDYLKALLLQLWDEKEGFSGKRPFGNSSWTFDLYKALVRGKAMEGHFDEDGNVEGFDGHEADVIIREAIEAL